MTEYANIKGRNKKHSKLGVEQALSNTDIDIIGSILWLSGLLAWLLLPIILIVKRCKR